MASLLSTNVKTLFSGVTSVFEDARTQIDRDIDKIARGLASKKAEMFAEIDKLEREFVDSYQHKQTELSKLKALQTQAGQLSEEILSTMQRSIAKELEQGIDKLNSDIENRKNPGYQIGVMWGMCLTSLLSQINSSTILVNKVTQRSPKPNRKTKLEIHQPTYSLRRERAETQITQSKRYK